MRPLRFIPLMAALVLAGCAQVPVAPNDPNVRAVDVPPVPLAESRVSPRPLESLYQTPDGPGPFPAVIIMHGCGGRSNRLLVWARRLNRWGYAAIIPDSLRPRGLTSVCAPMSQPSLTPQDRVADIAAAAAWLRARPEIDGKRIAVLGQSHGGSTAATAARRTYDDAIHLKAAVDYYGRCGSPMLQGATPLLALAGEDDDWGNPALNCLAFGRSVNPGSVFEVHTYPGVHHGFDSEGMAPTTSNGHVMRYDHDAAEDSFVRVRAFLDRFLKP
jgi:dienelactone hydrolase